MPLLIRLADRGVTLATRPLAAQIRVEALERAGETTAIELDFTDVLSVSYSFADELVGKLAQEASDPDQIKILNATTEVQRILGRAMERRLGEPVIASA